MDEVDIFKALSNSTRLKILELIKKEPKCICDIINKVDKSQPNISIHIKILKNAGLILEKKQGTNVFIQATNKNIFEIIEIARSFKN